MTALLSVQPHSRHRRDHAVGLRGDDLGALVRHQAGDRQLDQRQLLALADDDDAAADLLQAVGGQRHVVAVGADDDHVVAVVRDGRGHRAVDGVAEARDEAR